MMTTQPGVAGEPMSPPAAFLDLARRMMYIHDPDNVSAFLLSYRTYEVIGADLCVIWTEEFVKACEKEKADEFRRAVKKKTSERMLDFLEIWLTRYNPNFSSRETEKVLSILNERTDSAIANKFKLLLVKANGSEEKKDKKDKKDKMTTSSSGSPARSESRIGDSSARPPFSPLTERIPEEADLKSFKFDLLEEFSPSIIARQLTLYEWDIFSRVKPEEFLNQSWAKEHQWTMAPNLTRLIEHFNKISTWVVYETLTKNYRDRPKTLRKFISMAHSCLEINNYNAALEILAGLNHGAIQRLKMIWEKLPDREIEIYKAMDSLMQPRNNFRNYRKDLISKPLPAFPQMSLICRDFTYIYDGNSKYNDDGSINFDLPMLLYERIKEIEKYQSVPYDFPKNDKVLSYFPYFARFLAYDEDYLHDLSLEAQPSMWGTTHTIIESEETNSENTPGDDESDSASSESGSSKYIKAQHPTRTSDADPMTPPSRRASSDGPSKLRKRGSAKDDDDSSSSSSSLSERRNKTAKKKIKDKKTKKDTPDGSEDTLSPREEKADGQQSPRKGDTPKRPRKRDPASPSLQVVKTGPSKSGPVCTAVRVPADYIPTFAGAESLVDKFFSQVAHSTAMGTTTIGNKRYLLIRSSSLSVKFFSAISKTFTFSSKTKGDEFFRKLVFNFGQIIGRSDVRTLSRTVALKTPLQIYAAGPIYQAYAGLGFSEILPEFDNLASPTGSNISVVTNHLVSSEAVAWKAANKRYTHPCCYLLNGYLSGWASGAFNTPLVGVEVLCATKGDKVCRTLLCSPEKAKATVKAYLSAQDIDEEVKSKVQIPSLLSVEDAETYQEARKEMNQKQKKGLFEKNKKLITVNANKEELDNKERKLQSLEKKSMHYFSAVYAERRYNMKEGQVLVGDEPYVFLRGKALSKGLVELILEMFPEGRKSQAVDFAFDFLFDLSHSIGKADYKYAIHKLAQKGRDNLHPLKKMIGLKKAFGNLGWGSVRFDFRTANLVYSKEHFFLRFMIENSFESSVWAKAKQKMQEEEEARKEVEEAAQELAKQKGLTLEEAFRKLEKANKTAGTIRHTKQAEGESGGYNLVLEVGKSPTCVMCAGFANGYLQKCFKNKEAKDRDLDLVVVEVACQATGSPHCEFLMCAKNMVLSTVKTYLKEKNQSEFFSRIKFYNVLRKKNK